MWAHYVTDENLKKRNTFAESPDPRLSAMLTGGPATFAESPDPKLSANLTGGPAM
jgi:hypothetical protein